MCVCVCVYIYMCVYSHVHLYVMCVTKCTKYFFHNYKFKTRTIVALNAEIPLNCPGQYEYTASSSTYTGGECLYPLPQIEVSTS